MNREKAAALSYAWRHEGAKERGALNLRLQKPEHEEAYGYITRMTDEELDAMLDAPLQVKMTQTQKRRAAASRGSGER